MDDVLVKNKTIEDIFQLKKNFPECEILEIAIERFLHRKELERKFNLQKFGSTLISNDAV